jgi:hypothetical protein
MQKQQEKRIYLYTTMLDLAKLVLEEEEEEDELAHFSIGWEEGCVLVSLQKHRKKNHRTCTATSSVYDFFRGENRLRSRTVSSCASVIGNGGTNVKIRHLMYWLCDLYVCVIVKSSHSKKMKRLRHLLCDLLKKMNTAECVGFCLDFCGYKCERRFQKRVIIYAE